MLEDRGNMPCGAQKKLDTAIEGCTKGLAEADRAGRRQNVVLRFMLRFARTAHRERNAQTQNGNATENYAKQRFATALAAKTKAVELCLLGTTPP